VYNGRTRQVAHAPIRGADVLVDHNHEVRIAMGIDPTDNNKYKIYHRAKKGDDWALLNRFGSLEGSLIPLSFTKNPDEIYLLGNIDSDTSSLYRYNLKTKASELVFNHKTVDVTSTYFDFDGNPIVLELDPGKTELEFIDNQHIVTRWLFSLKAHFPN
jgi:hypothetical protein